jgi:hypothetical protein
MTTPDHDTIKSWVGFMLIALPLTFLKFFIVWRSKK